MIPPDKRLCVEALSVRRGARRVLNDVSFHVDPGEIITIIGPNGAGKTSLLEAIVGILPRTTGRVRYGGRPVTTFRDLAGVFAFMPDAAEPPAEMRVVAVIEHMRRAGGLKPDEQLLASLRLTSLLKVFVGELSRGEKRRLILLGALCSNRPIVVLDEPLSVFDPLQMIDIVDVLRQRVRSGGSILLTVHQMADAEKIASRIVVLDAGELIAAGSLTDLRALIHDPGAALEKVFLDLLRTRTADAAS